MKHATDRSPAIWRLSIRLIPLLFTAIQVVAAPAEHGDISGTWQLTVVGPDGTNFERIQLKVDGDKISGKHGQSGNLEGTLKADKLEIKEYGDDKKLGVQLLGPPPAFAAAQLSQPAQLRANEVPSPLLRCHPARAYNLSWRYSSYRYRGCRRCG